MAVALGRQETFRTAMRQNAMEFDEARASSADSEHQGINFATFCKLIREREVSAEEIPEEELRERFLALDTNGSGIIGKDEYMRFSLRDSLARSASKLMSIFSEWDINQDGSVDVKEFQRAIRALGFDEVSDRDIEHIFREYDLDGGGTISRFELESRIKKHAGIMVEQKYALRRTAGGKVGAALSIHVKLDRSGDVPISDQLRAILEENCVRIIDLFRDWDENGDGLVSKAEFVKAMAALGIEASPSETGALFDQFDPDGSGTIEYKELHALLRRRIDVHTQWLHGGSRYLRRARSEGVLPTPTIPWNATLPSVASIPHLSPPRLTHAGRYAKALRSAASGTQPWPPHVGTSIEGGSLHPLVPTVQRSFTDGALISQYSGVGSGFSIAGSSPLSQVASNPHLRGEVLRLRSVTNSEISMRLSARRCLAGPQHPTNTWSWPAVQGVPDIDHLAQLWLAPRFGPYAYNRQPNVTAVKLVPLSKRLEKIRRVSSTSSLKA